MFFVKRGDIKFKETVFYSLYVQTVFVKGRQIGLIGRANIIIKLFVDNIIWKLGCDIGSDVQTRK